MAQDALEEISGIKPNVWLADGEEREVGSATSKSKYKVKRTFDHYYCSCPAWRNRSGAPVNARTCKHLKAFLGEDYEEARIALKNPDGPPAKAGKAKPKATTSKAKLATKRKRVNDGDDDEGEGDKPTQKKSRQTRATKPDSKRSKTEPKDVEMTSVHEETAPSSGKDQAGDDLAQVNGIKPLVLLQDGEECEVGSSTSRSKYKVKRTFDHYYCACPAWRMQARIPVNARTCKHLRSLLGDAYEDARVELKRSGHASGDLGAKPASKAKPGSRTKPPSNVKTSSKPVKGKQLDAQEEAVTEDVGVNDNEGDDDPEGRDTDEKEGEDEERASPESGRDELAEINGVTPNVYLKDGEEREVSSQSSSSKYKVKRTWDHYYCSCPAWRNQGGVPVNARTCKHLKTLLGEEYETTRLLFKNPDGPQPKVKAAPKRSRAKGKTKAEDGNEGDEEDGVTPSGKNIPELLLANKWDLDSGPDPTGWWISEKLDGVRTYFDGRQMISRLGNPFTPPQWFLEKLPKDVTLDGELFGGRGEFQSTVSIVKTVNSPNWKSITFQVFDVPSRGNEPFEARFALLKELFGPGGSYYSEQIVVVEQELAQDRQHVLDKLKEVEAMGGEGLMLRKPGSLYEGYRSSTLLKIKTFYDAEAIVTGYVDGKGKHKGATGALKCQMASGKTFNAGSGLSDKQRKNPPKIGSIIVYRFQELTKDGVPRFPTFVGIAADKDKPRDADIPPHKLAGAQASDA
ncbi:hypothetical protein P691DRAFT_810139 [Macrolepiota fuliginosa MF-IS2]|uniref:SWIM-type domain-containing protein n=1 Tax=Macrolepiota fuliginosa MF-IS2 TaxID=1400762 RepID=A0A9P6BYQ5_9AGAR|nr:hypothetical protein P691DRAFT_810139 [Macrolepiota fuliginosa MF-IS2]